MISTEKICLTFILCATLIFGATGLPVAPVYGADGNEGELVDGLVAQVNESYITLSDVMARIEPLRSRLIRVYRGRELEKRLEEAFEQVTGDLIARELVLDAYEKQERQLPETLIDERAHEIIREVFGGDRNELMKELATAQMTYEQWRESVREQMIISYMTRMRIDQNVDVSPLEVQEFYIEKREQFKEPRRVDVSMILLRGESGEALDSRIESVEKELGEGTEFAEVAKKYSDGNKAESGGDWGWVDLENLRKELQSAIEKLDPGQVSEPVKLENGVFFVKLKELRGGKPLLLKDVRDRIRDRIKESKRQRLYNEWISALRKKAVIKKWNVNIF